MKMTDHTFKPSFAGDYCMKCGIDRAKHAGDFHAPSPMKRSTPFFRLLSDPLEVCPFDKHRGKYWEDVVAEDRSYVEWLISGEGIDLEPDMIDRLTTLLEETEEE